jgi:hypothetical protein
VRWSKLSETAPSGLQRQGRRLLGQRGQGEGVPHGEGADAGGLLRAVDQGDAVAPLHGRKGDAGAAHRLRARQPVAPVADPGAAEADHRQRHVRERREVAAGPDRAAQRHMRDHAAVQHLRQARHGVRRDAAEAGGEDVQPDRHHGPHRVGPHGRAHAGGVAHQQAALLRGVQRTRDGPAVEGAEAGGQAVDRPALSHQRAQVAPALLHPPGGRLGEPHRLATPGDARDAFEREAPAVDLDHRPAPPPRMPGRSSPCSRAQAIASS